MERRGFLRGIAALGICPICAGIAQGAEGAHWSYEGEHGPEHWGDMDAANQACSVGSQQSPVDIRETTSATLDPIVLAWAAGAGSILNNGHTMQYKAPAGNTLTRGARKYEMLQFHFHAPSEHLVEGEPYAMEVHFVHKSVDSGDLGVLGVFMVPGAANPAFAKLAAAFPAEEGEAPLEVDPRDLLPSTLDYWAYEGSLTTPPCSEIVDWMVARQPIEVAPEDIAKFTGIYPMNARPAEPASRRFILSSV